MSEDDTNDRISTSRAFPPRIMEMAPPGPGPQAPEKLTPPGPESQVQQRSLGAGIAARLKELHGAGWLGGGWTEGDCTRMNGDRADIQAPVPGNV